MPEPAANPQVQITSYGVLHAPAPAGNSLTVDLRTALRNPHHDPAMRELTGLDEPVRAHVLATPGARQIIEQTATRVLALLAYHRPGDDGPLLVHTFCQGGRHRSVAIAEAIAAQLRACGISAQVTHRDVTKPVVQK